MSEDNTTAEKKGREPKKNSIPATEIAKLVHGIPQYTKASFLVIGHKNGVRIALPKTSGVSRAYFYANGDYTLIPTHEAITSFDEAQRKDGRKGGIMAEVDFEKGLDKAREALALLVEVVRKAPAPAAKPEKPKAPKQPKKVKAVAAAEAGTGGTQTEAVTTDDAATASEGETAEA